jgi:MFS family permease
MASRSEKLADWFGLNRATVAVLVIIGCLGLSEEVWSNFLSLYFKEQTGAVLKAAAYIGVVGFLRNLLEGVGYIVGGRIAHRLGPRVALAVSAVPMTIGSICMLVSHVPWGIALGAILMSNWEPLSVPATYEVVGSEVPKHRRTIAFAVQSIQKRLPKVIGPAGGAIAFAIVGYWLNVTIALGLVGIALVLQLVLTPQMRAKAPAASVPLGDVVRAMPRELRLLLSAEIFIRWGDWFAREFAPLYVAARLLGQAGWSEAHAAEAVGALIALMNLTALATYVPIAKWIDRLPSPRPFIGTTFLLFALFPISLVLLPRAASALGLPIVAGFVVAYVLNGLREIGEPARKALISGGFPPEVRARAVGLYWGIRSFAFCPAPLVAAFLWSKAGPDVTFLVGGAIGLVGTVWFAATNRLAVAKNARVDNASGV